MNALMFRFVPVDLIPIVFVGATFAFIIFLTLRSGYRSVLKARKRAAAAAAPFASAALDGVDAEEVVDVAERLANLGEDYALSDLIQIARDVRAQGRSFNSEESDAFLPYFLQWNRSALLDAGVGVVYDVAAQDSDLEMCFGELAEA